MFLMMPGVLFICLFGLCSGLLQCEKRYFGTGFAPAAFNCVWIIAVFCLKDTAIPSAVASLSLAVILAFFVQWMMIAPQTVSLIRPLLGWKECLRPQLFSLELRQMIKPFLLGTIGIAATQVNSTLDAIFARCASLEGPAYLWYAIRIQQLPLSLFGIALATALLPPLSRAVKEGNLLQYLKLLQFSLRRSFSLIFPCTLGIFALGAAGVNLLYGHGDFTGEAIFQTVLCLWGYGLGLVPSVFVLLLAPAFYAKKQYKIPMQGAVFSMILNLFLTSFFVFILEWGALSIALATSVCAWANYFYLSYAQTKIQGTSLDTTVHRSFFQTGASTLCAFCVTLFVGRFFLGDPTLAFFFGEEIAFSSEIFTQLRQFVALIGIFLTSLFVMARLLKAEDLLSLCRKFQRRN